MRGVATADDISIAFSVEELVALSDALGVPPLPGLDPEPLGPVAPDARHLLLDAARRSLAARGVMKFGEGGQVTVVPPVAALLSIAAAPGLCAQVLCQFPDERRRVTFTAQTDVTVEHLHAGWLHRLSPFATEQIVARILEVAGLDRERGGGQGAFTVPALSLQRCGDLVLAGDTEGASAALLDGGAPAEVAAAFVAALAGARASITVTLLHQPDTHHLAGGELAWIDGGGDGLWLVPLPGGEAVAADLPAAVEATTTSDIARLLVSYVPGGT